MCMSATVLTASENCIFPPGGDNNYCLSKNRDMQQPDAFSLQKAGDCLMAVRNKPLIFYFI